MAKAAPSPRRSGSKIKSPTALKRVLAEIRRKRRKVVFTNGVFDILHPGHVAYLEEARRQGDLLVVALNSDDSTRRIKGPTRPICPLSDRMATLAGLESVDFVTSFNELTPLNLIVTLKPDILVKGGDWRVDQIVGGPEVLSWGGRVKSLKFMDGKSSTNVIEKILS